MSEHTKGRLEGEYPYIFAEDRSALIASMTGTGGDEARKVAKANARRLVACWNACLDAPTEYLERAAQNGDLALFGEQMFSERNAMQSRAEAAESDMAAAERDRDELIAALRVVLPMAKGYAAEHRVGNNAQMVEEAEAVLAKYEKVPQ